ncbi:hypothetical protein OsI_26118 [Oryza sativa Indica Group]|uniref:Disease resistance N-terminal domain-containing protein n=1 Tax=Oryza sativa subsp. indica TaxID=39946 RepID=B8B6F1_ORYSI|nr:hypothetical protein OsI_26118 [Oryza sativa Indica Group]
MAEAIVGPLVGRLQELALGQARALVGVNADIQKLKDKLMWLQAFLREADAKRRAVSDEVTKVWVLQTRDAVFDAEDALDHYYLQLDKSSSRRAPCDGAGSCAGGGATPSTSARWSVTSGPRCSPSYKGLDNEASAYIVDEARGRHRCVYALGGSAPLSWQSVPTVGASGRFQPGGVACVDGVAYWITAGMQLVVARSSLGTEWRRWRRTSNGESGDR